MPRKTTAKQSAQSPIQNRKQELERQAEQIKQELSKTREFLDKAPALIAEVQRKQQRAIIERFQRPQRLGGPSDIRYDFDPGRRRKPPKPLRKERSKAPLVTLLLLAAFCAVMYYAWRVMWH